MLKDPQLEGDKLTYTVDLLEGSLPAKGELVSMLHRPLRPAALAGLVGGHQPAPASAGALRPSAAPSL